MGAIRRAAGRRAVGPGLAAAIVAGILSLTGSALAQEHVSTDGDLPFSVMLRTNQGWGLAHDGYTTLGGLIGVPLDDTSTYENGLPFLDLRGHVENDGGFALTSDLGYRWADWDDFRIYGIHAGFDWRQNKGHIDTQWINLGVETLGYDWDFRLDGYIPVGNRTDVECMCVEDYEGNEAILDYRTFVGMGGIEGEFALNNNRGNWGIVNEMPTTVALRLHWFDGQEGDSATGGQVRLEIEPWRSVFVQGAGGYDTEFGAIATIRIGLRFWESAASDDRPYKLQERFVDPIERQELVVGGIQHINRTFTDDMTGNAVPFYHIDNTFDAGGTGTFEDRFQSFAEAEAATPEGAIMILHRGDGTTTFYDTDLEMKDSQSLIGAGFAGTLDLFERQICFMGDLSKPSVTNPTNGNGVTMANDNLVAGIQFLDTNADNILFPDAGQGIFTNGGINGRIIGNMFIGENLARDTPGADYEDAIQLRIGGGNWLIQDNMIQNYGDEAVHIQTTMAGSADVMVLNNSLNAGEEGVLVDTFGTFNLGIGIVGNDIFDGGSSPGAASTGITLFARDTSHVDLTIVDNDIHDPATAGVGGILLSRIGTTSSYTALIEDNRIFNVYRTGIAAIGAGDADVAIRNNVITNIIGVGPTEPRAIRAASSAPTDRLCIDLEGNVLDQGAEIGLVGAGSEELEPLVGNSGVVSVGADVVPVANGTCGP